MKKDAVPPDNEIRVWDTSEALIHHFMACCNISGSTCPRLKKKKSSLETLCTAAACTTGATFNKLCAWHMTCWQARLAGCCCLPPPCVSHFFKSKIHYSCNYGTWPSWSISFLFSYIVAAIATGTYRGRTDKTTMLRSDLTSSGEKWMTFKMKLLPGNISNLGQIAGPSNQDVLVFLQKFFNNRFQIFTGCLQIHLYNTVPN